jgi:hypothetical protein
LNALQTKYGKQGLTIIGVTDESTAKIEPFIKEKDISYLIAIGGAPGYKTSGIPHAWLVSGDQEIVWEGHPGSLTNGQIEEHLKGVRLVPTFELPKELRTAQSALDKGNFGSGLKALEKYLESPKDDEVAKAAKEAVEKINAYGKSQLEAAETYAKEAFYTDAIEILTVTEKSFKGTEVGDKAKARKDEWMKDSVIKAEIQGDAIIAEAKALAQKSDSRRAVALLTQLVRSKKFEGTKARARASEMLSKLDK